MAVNWRITSQRQIDQLTGTGSFEPAMEVHYETIPDGIPGMVTVSLRYYTADNVRTEIENRVAVIQEIQNL